MTKTMRLIFITLFTVTVVSCAPLPREKPNTSSTEKPAVQAPVKKTAIPPDWFVRRESAIPTGFLIGYGHGGSPDEAKAGALREIAENIEVAVTSEYRLSRLFTDKNGLRRAIDETIKIRSEQALTDVKSKKHAYLDGVYYAAYIFDNRRLIERVAEVLPNVSDSGRGEKITHQILPFAQELLRLKKHPNFHIAYKNKRWHVIAGDKTFPVQPAEWYQGFFTAKKTAGIVIDIDPKENRQTGEHYFLKIQHGTAGYLSLFSVYENGQVLRLGKANRSVKPDGKFIFPDPEKYDGLIAENPTDKLETRDLLIAALCVRANDHFSGYAGVHQDATDTDDVNLFSYDRLLDDLSGCGWSGAFLFIHR